MKGLIKFALNTIPRKYLIRLSYVFRKISQYTNKGNNVECPVCKATFRKFLPYGYEQVRDNALCPKCLSLERHRLVWIYLHECTSFFESPLKVLHIAPEQCFEERFKNLGNLEYITADLESPLADYKCDVQNLPFGKNEFDIVICNHVLEHVDDDKRAMSEILRVMKPGARAILLVPMDFNRKDTYENPSVQSAKERKLHFGQYDHQRLYGLDFPERLKNIGFKIPEKNYLDEIPDEKKIRFGLPKVELMYGYKKSEVGRQKSEEKI
jgi:SAM-dependent methyltransferase